MIATLAAALLFAPPKFRVMFVGLGPYSKMGAARPDLHGEHDCDLVKAELVRRYGLKDGENIHKLTGKGDTTEAIRREFADWLVRNAGPDDRLVFYYSGHGTLTRDKAGKVCSAIVPIDAQRHADWSLDPAHLLGRDFFNAEPRELRAKGATNVTLIFDSCQSGSIARGSEAISKFADNPGVGAPPPGAPTDGAGDLDFGDAVIVGAAKEGRNAFEVRDQGGNLTVSLVKAMEDHFQTAGAGELGYQELKDRVNANMASLMQPVPQEPVFAAKNLLRPVFGTGTVDATPGYLVSVHSDDTGIRAPFLQAGVVLGLAPGCRVALYSTAAGLKGEPLATAKIVESKSYESRLELESPAVKLVSLNATYAKLIDGTPDARIVVDLSELRAVPGMAPVADRIEALPLVGKGPGLASLRILAPKSGEKDAHSATEWVAIDGGGNPIQGGRLTRAATPEEVGAWVESSARDAARFRAIQTMRSVDLWIKLEVELVPVTTEKVAGGERLTGFVEGAPQSKSVDADEATRVAIRVRATLADGTKADDTYDRKPYLTLLDLTANGQVLSSWPAQRGNPERLRLVPDGQWVYLGTGGDGLVPANEISRIEFWMFFPDRDGVGQELFRILTTDVDLDVAPLLTAPKGSVSRGPGANGGLDRILGAFRDGLPIVRGDPGSAQTSDFALADAVLNVRAKNP